MANNVVKANSLRPDFSSSTMDLMTSNPNNSLASTRETARIQGEVFMAKQFPRDINKSLQKIEADCSRFTLAQSATYQYARGGSSITGPSIRLAEALARAFGNIRYGFEMVEQDEKRTTLRAYCYDIETNTQAERYFFVQHKRDTKKGSVELTAGRDIYEAVANEASRRERACILEIIPKDIVDYALDLCQRTLSAKIKITPDSIQALINAFKEFGVSQTMIEAKIQSKLTAISTNKYIELKRIWQSLNDGVGVVEDFFDTEVETKKITETIAPKVEAKTEVEIPVQEPMAESEYVEPEGEGELFDGDLSF